MSSPCRHSLCPAPGKTLTASMAGTQFGIPSLHLPCPGPCRLDGARAVAAAVEAALQSVVDGAAAEASQQAQHAADMQAKREGAAALQETEGAGQAVRGRDQGWGCCRVEPATVFAQG